MMVDEMLTVVLALGLPIAFIWFVVCGALFGIEDDEWPR